MDQRFCYFELAHKSENRFIRTMARDAGEIAQFRTRWGDRAIFMSAYRYSSADRSGEIYAPYFYLDLDDSTLAAEDPEEAENAWVQIRREFLYICSILDVYYGIKREHIYPYFSGKKGLTIVIPSAAFGLEAGESLNEIMRLIAEDIATCVPYANLKSIDMKVYDRARLLRMPNSIHEDTGLYKVLLTPQEVLKNSLRQVKEIAARPRNAEPAENVPASPKAVGRVKYIVERAARKTATGKNGGLRYEPPCVKEALASGATAGMRNNTLAALADYYKQRGLPYEETLSLLLEWNTTKCAPPLRQSEVVATVRSIYRHEYRYGCRTFQHLGWCRMEGCRIASAGTAHNVPVDGAGATGIRRDIRDNRARQDRAKYGV